ncbi:MAG: radical SAM protein, partial [Spirochaetota bacterium]|nr:radical SAM protein [Spirochaetota bacterium]
YSEPVIHFEYIMECAELAHENGIKNVLITNGFLNPKPAKELLSIMDGVNVDLKAFTQSFYTKIGGKIDPVKYFIKLAAELTHLEVTTLIIPGENDSFDEIINIANFLSSIDPDIPLHISSYYPVYKYEISSTPKDTVLRLVEKASEVLNYVYPGNIF